MRAHTHTGLEVRIQKNKNKLPHGHYGYFIFNKVAAQWLPNFNKVAKTIEWAQMFSSSNAARSLPRQRMELNLVLYQM